MIVYVLRNNINNKVYVGQTIRTLNRRITAHMLKVKNGSKLPIHCAIRKYGINNFTIQVVKCPYKEQWALDWLEQTLIDDLDAMAPNGYNLTEGGMGGKPSKETRKKMSVSRMGVEPWNKGKKRPDCAGDNNYFHTHISIGKEHPRAVSVVLIHPDNKEESFDCITDIERKYGLNHSALSRVAKGKRNHHKNYKCYYQHKQGDSYG